MPFRPRSKLTRRRLAQYRRDYHNSNRRPFYLPSYRTNCLLLREGLNVIWEDIMNDLRAWLIEDDHQRVEMILMANVRGMTLNHLPLYCSPTLIEKIIEAGITVNFNLELTDYLKVRGFEELDYIDNVRYNIKNHLSPDFILEIDIGTNHLLRPLFKLVNQPYRVTTRNLSYGIDINFDEILEVDNDRDKDKLANYCVRNNNLNFLEVLLSTGYVPSIELLVKYRCRSDIITVILGSIYLTDDYKVQYLTEVYSYQCTQSIQFHNNPLHIGYLKMIDKDDYHKLHPIYRNFLTDGIVPVSGNVIDSNRLSRYQSIGLSDDNDNFLKYLQWKGIELPPPIVGRQYKSIVRIKENSELIDNIIKQSYRYDHMIILAQLMNEGLINLREYAGKGYYTIDRLCEYQPIMKTKAVRSIKL